MTTRKRYSTHFRAEEFDCQNGQRTPPEAREAVELLCNAILEKLRAEFGPCRVLSGYRPAAYNRAVGGAPDSRHIYDRPLTERPSLAPGTGAEAIIARGVAADVVFARGSVPNWAAAGRAVIVGSPYLRRRSKGGLGIYVDQGFVHLDTGPRREWRG